ncbi:MAG: energy-coupling factor transporter transmembrane protein EcfT, partial [bacterium]|nr:energy-coupling factor transporter transmembrane protein EcfT [bacterium]
AFLCWLIAWRAGWKRGGGPAWWMIGIMAVLSIVAFSIAWTPYLHWQIDGWKNGVTVAARLLGLVAIGVWFMAKLSPPDLAQLLERMLHPLARHWKSIRHIPMAITIALASSGWIRQEAVRIKLAMNARNVRWDGKLSTRIDTVNRLFSMLLIAAMRRADAMTVALYCRGWRDNTVPHRLAKNTGTDRMVIVSVWFFSVMIGIWDRWL